jgi:hypothetical protein
MENNMAFEITSWTPEWYASATDDDKLDFKNWLSEYLINNDVLNIKFIKSDSTERIMNCTLKASVVNAAYENGSVRPVNEIQDLQQGDAFTVWDIDAENWRCFRLDRLLEINYTV